MKAMLKIKPTFVFLMLCSAFLLYSFSIYLAPTSNLSTKGYNQKLAMDGQLVWQKHNCQSCHQIYGLGGYLGPDLTNFLSDTLKSELVLRAMLKNGVRQMPKFNMNEKEIDNLIAFLKSTNASGKSSPNIFKVEPNGIIERK